MFKKVTSVMLSLLLISVCAAGEMSVSAEEAVNDATNTKIIRSSGESVSGDFKYEVNSDGTAIIKKYTGSEKTLIIPSELDGHKVVETGREAPSYNLSLESLVIPDSVTVIGYGSFFGCTGLKKLTLPNSLKEIDTLAFGGCYKLEKVEIPKLVYKLGDNCFDYCSDLKIVTISGKITDFGRSVFSKCSSLESVNINAPLEIIGNNAFMSCLALKSIAK